VHDCVAPEFHRQMPIPPVYGTANRWMVLAGVTAGLVVAGLPLYFKEVRQREMDLAEARYAPRIDPRWHLIAGAHQHSGAPESGYCRITACAMYSQARSCCAHRRGQRSAVSLSTSDGLSCGCRDQYYAPGPDCPTLQGKDDARNSRLSTGR
jgi:hypothetical protein